MKEAALGQPFLSYELFSLAKTQRNAKKIPFPKPCLQFSSPKRTHSSQPIAKSRQSLLTVVRCLLTNKISHYEKVIDIISFYVNHDKC